LQPGSPTSSKAGRKNPQLCLFLRRTLAHCTLSARTLSIRMGMRRMTRLTNAFSKKWENLQAAYSLWFAFYNFCRRHQTLRVSPAMEAGLADHIWTIEELIA
jgi:hypothetical protein